MLSAIPTAQMSEALVAAGCCDVKSRLHWLAEVASGARDAAAAAEALVSSCLDNAYR